MPRGIYPRPPRRKYSAARKRKYWLNYRAKNRRKVWGWRLKRFGLTPDSFDRQVKRQKGCCQLCKRKPRPQPKRSMQSHGLVADHNHRTGKFRGLLCDHCNNRVIGFIEKHKIPLSRIRKYLK